MRPHSRVASALSVSLLLVALSGCRLASPAHTASSATATTQATATPATLPKLPTAIASGACGNIFSDTAPLSHAGGLVVTQYSGLGNLAYPEAQIPSSQTAHPIPVPTISDPPYFTDSTTAVVNPSLSEGSGGYVLRVCNASSQAHTVSAVQVSIAQISPVTGVTQAWAMCSGDYIPGNSDVSDAGCGGGDIQNEYMHAGFAPDAQVGTSVTATQTGSNTDLPGSPDGPLPVTLQPGQILTVEVGVTQPSAAGYYTYAFGLTVDGAATGVVAYSLRTLLDPHVIQWSGKNCLASVYQSQIAQMPTPTTGRLFLVCPPSQ